MARYCDVFDGFYFIAQIHPHIECDLVVAAARGVKPLSSVADAFGEHLLDKHMNILRLGVKNKRAAFKVSQNALQAADDAFAFAFIDDTGIAEHFGVRHAAGDILFIHTAVKGDRRVEIVDALVLFLFEPSLPHFHCVSNPLYLILQSRDSHVIQLDFRFFKS